MRALIFILLFFAAQLLSAQDTAMVRTFGGPYNDYGAEIIQTSDGGYAFIGTTGSHLNGQSNMYLVKLGADLGFEWSRVFGGDNLEWGQSLVETDDGYLLLGYTNSFGAGGYDIYLVHCDHSGDMIWQKTYGGTDWDFGYKILAHNDSYYIAGESWSFSNGGSDAYIIRVDDEGTELWSSNFGGSENDYFNSLFLGENGPIAIGTNASEAEKTMVFMMEFAPDNSTTEHLFGDTAIWYEGNAGYYHSNGSYYIAGAKESDDFSNYLFRKYSTSFEPEDLAGNPTGGGDLEDVAYSLIECTNGELVTVGASDSYTGSTGAYMLRLTSEGWWLAGPTFGAGGTDISRSIIRNDSNQLVILGETNSFGAGNYDAYLVKFPNDTIIQNYVLDEEFIFDQLLTSSGPELTAEEDAFQVFPNPAKDWFSFSGEGQWESIALFDVTGKITLRKTLTGGNPYIEISGLKPGVYFVELSGRDGQSARKRLVVE